MSPPGIFRGGCAVDTHTYTHTTPTLHPHCTHTYMHTQPPPIKQVLREAFLPGAAAAAVYLFFCNLHHIARWMS